MRLSEAIQQVKTEKPHSFSDDHCTIFINEVEAMVQEFLNVPAEERKKYDWVSDGNAVLFAPEPYNNLYISWLKAKIDYAIEEYESYANNQAQFNEDFESFKAWAVRTGKVGTKALKIRNWW